MAQQILYYYNIARVSMRSGTYI